MYAKSVFAHPKPTITQLIGAIIKSMPAVNGLNLSTYAELEQAFSQIPAAATSLNLRGCDLGNQSVAQLIKIFKTIPARFTSIDLSDNNLGKKTVAELAQALKELDNSITSINLSTNGLGNTSAADLGLPAKLTVLGLSEENELRDTCIIS